MTGSQAQFVRHGPFIDYGRSSPTRHQWAWTKPEADAFVAAMAILVTIACQRLFKISQRAVVVILHRYNLRRGHHPTPSGVYDSESEGALTPSLESGLTETTPLIAPAAAHLGIGRQQNHGLEDDEGFTSIELRDIHEEAPTVEGAAFRHLKKSFRHWHLGRCCDRHCFTRSNAGVPEFMIAFLLYFVYVGFNAFGVMTSGLASQSIGLALSASPDCGKYIADVANATDYAAALRITRPYQRDVELESALYAAKCYHAPENADGCNFFRYQSIPTATVENDVECPFRGGMCHLGSKSALKLSTGKVDSQTIGVNAPKRYTFERNSTCAPLNMNASFISLHEADNMNIIRYHYGASSVYGNNWMFEAKEPQTMPEAGGYRLSTFISNRWLNTPGLNTSWQPLPELRPPEGSSITIMIIKSQRVYYPTPNDDPIFPAHNKTYLDGFQEPYYLNLLEHATILACVDTTSLCDPRGEICEPFPSERIPGGLPKGRAVLAGLELLLSALWNSNTYYSLLSRTDQALNATASLAVLASLPLPRDQWKVEVRHRFEESLARIQMDARDAARGTMAKYSGFVNISPNNIMCGAYIFRADGWSNVDRTASIIVLVVCLALLLLGIPGDEHDLMVEGLIWGASHNSCVATCAGSIASCVRGVARFVGTVLSLSKTCFWWVFGPQGWDMAGRSWGLAMTTPQAMRRAWIAGTIAREFMQRPWQTWAGPSRTASSRRV